MKGATLTAVHQCLTLMDGVVRRVCVGVGSPRCNVTKTMVDKKNTAEESAGREGQIESDW